MYDFFCAEGRKNCCMPNTTLVCQWHRYFLVYVSSPKECLLVFMHLPLHCIYIEMTWMCEVQSNFLFFRFSPFCSMFYVFTNHIWDSNTYFVYLYMCHTRIWYVPHWPTITTIPNSCDQHLCINNITSHKQSRNIIW